MSQFRRITLAIAASGTLALLPLVAQALITPVHWSLSGCSDGASSGNPNYGNSCTFTDTNGTGTTVRATAWANRDSNTNTVLDAAVRQFGGGLGVNNRGEGYTNTGPMHTLDNGGSLDLILFEFETSGGSNRSVNLESIAQGFFSADSGYNDTDVSVLAWRGASDPNLNSDLAGKTWRSDTQNLDTDSNNPDTSGWDLIGNYQLNRTSNSLTAINPNDVSSSYWLVGAYSWVFGGNVGSHSGKDGVKLSLLKGSFETPDTPPTGVPEPASLLLLAGVLPFMRRRATRQAA